MRHMFACLVALCAAAASNPARSDASTLLYSDIYGDVETLGAVCDGPDLLADLTFNSRLADQMHDPAHVRRYLTATLSALRIWPDPPSCLGRSGPGQLRITLRGQPLATVRYHYDAEAERVRLDTTGIARQPREKTAPWKQLSYAYRGRYGAADRLDGAKAAAAIAEASDTDHAFLAGHLLYFNGQGGDIARGKALLEEASARGDGRATFALLTKTYFQSPLQHLSSMLWDFKRGAEVAVTPEMVQWVKSHEALLREAEQNSVAHFLAIQGGLADLGIRLSGGQIAQVGTILPRAKAVEVALLRHMAVTETYFQDMAELRQVAPFTADIISAHCDDTWCVISDFMPDSVVFGLALKIRYSVIGTPECRDNSAGRATCTFAAKAVMRYATHEENADQQRSLDSIFNAPQRYSPLNRAIGQAELALQDGVWEIVPDSLSWRR